MLALHHTVSTSIVVHVSVHKKPLHDDELFWLCIQCSAALRQQLAAPAQVLAVLELLEGCVLVSKMGRELLNVQACLELCYSLLYR